MAKKQTPAPAPVVEPVAVVEEVVTPAVVVVEETPAPVVEEVVAPEPVAEVTPVVEVAPVAVEAAPVVVEATSTVEVLKDLASKVNVRPGGTISQRGGVTLHTLLTDATGVQSLTDLIAAVKAL